MLQNNFILRGLLMTILFYAAPLAAATVPADITVSSHAFKFDAAKNMAFYEGDVFAQQAEKKIWGDKLEIYRSPKGEIDKIVVHGNLARYQGSMGQGQPILEASAKKITYLPKTEYFILEEKAEISQHGEFYRAPRIEYDAKLQKISSPVSGKGHTSIVLKKSQH